VASVAKIVTVTGKAEMMKQTAVIYDRASLHKQEDNYSRADAKSEGIRIAEANGFEWEYEKEIGSGATLTGRPVMMSILDRIATGEIHAIVCQDLDRLARPEERATYETIRNICLENGVKVYTQSGIFDFANDNDDFMADINMAVAKKERRTIIKRSIRGMKERAKEGGFNGGRPALGYKLVYTSEDPSKATSDLAIDDNERQLAEAYFDAFLEHRNLRAAANKLNGLGYTGKYGGKITRATIKLVVENPIYAGFMTWGRNKGSIYLKSHEVKYVHRPDLQIVPVEEWERAQEILEERSIKQRSPGQHGRHIYTGIIQCPICHGPVLGARRKVRGGRKVVQYACIYTVNSGVKSCRGQTFSEHKVNAVVIPFLVDLINQQLCLNDALQEAAEHYGKTATEAELEQQIKAELLTVEEAKKRLIKAIAGGILTDEEAKAEMDELRASEQRLQRDLATIDEKAAIRADYLKAIEALKDTDIEARLTWMASEKPSAFRRLLQLLFEPNSLAIGKERVKTREMYQYYIESYTPSKAMQQLMEEMSLTVNNAHPTYYGYVVPAEDEGKTVHLLCQVKPTKVVAVG
jgi:site-specific DNA recombinase